MIIGLNSLQPTAGAPIYMLAPSKSKAIILPDTIDFLKTRRSVKPREMSGPGPSQAELETILTVGSRVPDHGKLAPWRFIVFEGDARARAGEVIANVFARKNPQAPAADVETAVLALAGDVAKQLLFLGQVKVHGRLTIPEWWTR